MTVLGNKIVDKKEIEAIASSYLEGNYLYFFPKRNIFLYPRSAIEAEVSLKNPHIETAHAFRKGKSLDIEITERIPVAAVCDHESRCFLADANGFIFSTAPNFSSTVYKEFVLSDSATTTTVGQSFLDASTFRSVLEFTEGVAELGLHAPTIVVRDDGDFTILAQAPKATSTVEIYIRKGTLDQALTNLRLFLGKTPKKTLTSIDLRYGNSIFFK